jgi:hypothetical protein
VPDGGANVRRAPCINGCAPTVGAWKWCRDCLRAIRQHERDQELHPWMRDPTPPAPPRMDAKRAARRDALERAGFRLVAA